MHPLTVLCFVAFVSLASCAGGWSGVANDDKDVLRIVKFAETELNARTNSMYRAVASTVHEARKQVVSGLKWKVTFDFGRTDCLKNEDRTDCNIDNSAVEQCEATVWEQSWLNKIGLVDFYCLPQPIMVTRPPTRRLPGGVYPIDDLKDAKLLEATDFVLTEFQTRDTCMLKSGVKEVTKASRQVVAGWKYFITLSVGYSKCPKSYTPKNDAECKLEDVQDSACPNQKCEVVVWDQPWRTPRYIMLSELKCVAQ